MAHGAAVTAATCEAQLRSAMLAALQQIDGVAALAQRVGDGPPHRLPMPHVRIGDITSVDWGTKDAPGRELRWTVEIVDRGDDDDAVHAIAARVETATQNLSRDGGGWSWGATVLIRSEAQRLKDRRWRLTMQFRTRALLL